MENVKDKEDEVARVNNSRNNIAQRDRPQRPICPSRTERSENINTHWALNDKQFQECISERDPWK